MTTARRRHFAAFVLLAATWFAASELLMRMERPPLPASVFAILPAGVIASEFLTDWPPLEPRLYGILPAGDISLAINALFWAAFLLSLRCLIHRPSLGSLFLLVAIASVPLLALPEVLTAGRRPAARLPYPIGPIVPIQSPQSELSLMAASSLFWAAIVTTTFWIIRRLNSR